MRKECVKLIRISVKVSQMNIDPNECSVVTAEVYLIKLCIGGGGGGGYIHPHPIEQIFLNFMIFFSECFVNNWSIPFTKSFSQGLKLDQSMG